MEQQIWTVRNMKALFTGLAVGGASSVLSYTPASFGIAFEPPADEPAPRTSVGGASRGDLCPQTVSTAGQSRPVALLPQSNYGKTLEAHPTVMFYMPESNADGAIFTLKDEEKTLLYFAEISLDGSEGVVSFTLPDDAPVLEVGQRYQWFVVFQCEGQLYPDSYYIDGWIQRTIEADLQQDFVNGSALSKAAALGLSGIWYDSLATLATLRLDQPQSSELLEHWYELLEEVGLESLAEAPITLLN
ncbi:MAG: DUF928 domain-containing protein [Cyanobacteria bacterium P01_G01_bin.38]